MYTSLIISILIQIITGIMEFLSLFFHVPLQFSFLKKMMVLEVVVKFIEGLFYIYWLWNFKHIANITPKRYFDWVLTTPTMLVNLIFYLLFLEHREKKTSDSMQFFQLFHQEFSSILTILMLNWAMLLFGYLSEIAAIPLFLGLFLGFVPFLLYYYLIYQRYALLSKDGIKIFLYFFLFWSLYGIVAFFPYSLKNTCYNILDLFSKNFFGLFLFYLLFKNKE